MANWPPSPTVEDEATALAKEHGTSKVTVQSGDEQSVPSRGLPDQMPVIVDSTHDPNDRLDQSIPKASVPPKRTTSREPFTSFQHDTGLPTPPSSDSEARGRPQPITTSKETMTDNRTPRSMSAAGRVNSSTQRPTISRLHTDISGDLEQMRAGRRREPSPYSFTREAGTFKVDPITRFANDNLLTPTHTTASPVSLQNGASQDIHTSRLRDSDNSTDLEHKPKKSIRFARSPEAPPKPASPAKEQIPLQSSTIQERQARSAHRQDSVVSESYGDRKCAAGATADSVKTDSAKVSRSRSHPRNVSKVRESPYSSSAEDSGVSEKQRSTKEPGSDGHSVRHRSSHRHERPRFEEPLSHQIFSHMKTGSSDDDATRRVYHIRDGRGPMTPPSVSTHHHHHVSAEDYFTKAFHNNALKPARHTHRGSTDETAILSPPSSPPRTPRGDRSSRIEYFESPSSSPHRTPSHSRPPSLDESQIRELRAHSSLLSQATSTAAALASKTSPPTSRSASNAIETTFACSSNALPSKARSRASSPQRDRAQRFDSTTYGEEVMSKAPQTVPAPSRRPSTRDGLPKIDLSHVHNLSPPQRNATWTGSYAGSAHSTIPGMSSVLQPSLLNPTPQIYRSLSASTPQEVTQLQTAFNLPPCPRSQPTQGLRDWSSFKELAGLNFCPKCAHALSFTRYRTQMIRSLDKAYERPTICALSKPWIRLAFVQSVKMNRADLSLVKKASILPEGARPCEGSRTDVRMWWKLIDPATDRAVPDFFACSACVGSVHQVFPDLPDQFKRDVINQEKVCSLHCGSKHFNAMMGQLDQVAEKCRDRGKSSARYMQPFVDHVRRITRYPECARGTLLANRAWHFSNDLPEFTVCEACYEEVVWPQREKLVARDISKTTKIVPQSVLKGSTSVSTNVSNTGTQPTGCQLYSDRMRRLFGDVISGRITYETFRVKVKERHAVQCRLTEMNRMYEEDQKMGWDRRADIDKNRVYWTSIE